VWHTRRVSKRCSLSFTTSECLTRRRTATSLREEDPPIDGLLLVDKPVGVTSHDIVDVARRALRTRRIGHAGTLDPFATGLLVLLVGHATRLLPHLSGEPKVYEATIEFGVETETDDVIGTAVRTAPLPDESRVRHAIASLTGAFDQVPPAYSAKQVEGRRAYQAARRGQAFDLAPVRVTVHRWEVHALSSQRLDATITCAGGTYIRALARDLGRLSGSAAHVTSLRRTQSGPFAIADAVTVDDLRGGMVEPRPAIEAVSHLPVVRLTAGDVVSVRQGRTIPGAAATSSSKAALVAPTGELIALAERVGANWQPRVVIPDA
jgi:tRNA pseudouridine55 synthase